MRPERGRRSPGAIMLSKDEIYSILEEAFAVTQKGSETVHPFSRDVQLTGRDGIFDSLDAMLFLDLADDLLSRRIGREIDLIDGDVFARPDSPFANMTTLAGYIAEKLRTE